MGGGNESLADLMGGVNVRIIEFMSACSRGEVKDAQGVAGRMAVFQSALNAYLDRLGILDDDTRIEVRVVADID